jgi:aconitate hydratase
MGIVPLQYLEGQNADTLGLTGKEKYTIKIPQDVRPQQELTVEVRHSYYLLKNQL